MFNIVKGGGGSHSKAWRDKFNYRPETPVKERQQWVADRLSAMKNNTMKWAKQVYFLEDHFASFNI